MDIVCNAKKEVRFLIEGLEVYKSKFRYSA